MNDTVEQIDSATSVDFETFYRDRFPDAVRLAHLLVGSNIVAEDLAQEALLRIAPRLSHIERPAAYLNTTIVNLSRNWHRGRTRRVAREQSGLRIVQGVEDHDANEHRELLDLVDRLPFRQRTVLVARYWLDLPEAAIADLVGCRPGTVKSLASRAFDTLRKELP